MASRTALRQARSSFLQDDSQPFVYLGQEGSAFSFEDLDHVSICFKEISVKSGQGVQEVVDWAMSPKPGK